MKIKNSGGKVIKFSVRMNEDDYVFLDNLANSVNVSKSEMIRILLKSQKFRSKEHENTLCNKYDKL